MVISNPRNSPAVGDGFCKDAMRREYNATGGGASAPPFPCRRLEIKLQSELHQPRIVRCSGKSELGSAALNGEVFVGSGFVREGQIRMIPDVEEFGAKFEMHLLADWKLFDEGKVPVLQTGATNDVASSISESSQHGIGDEGAGVK